MDPTQSKKSVKRLLQELQEVLKDQSGEFLAYPIDSNLFQWHFTLRGPNLSPYENGFYHGKLIFPVNYPFEPPDIYFLTDNGRFQLNMKICISITSYHPENWSPSFTLPIILRALRVYMQSPGYGSVGSLDYPEDTVRRLAHESQFFSCKVCGQDVRDHISKLENIASKGDVAQQTEGKRGASLNPSPPSSERINDQSSPSPINPEHIVSDENSCTKESTTSIASDDLNSPDVLGKMLHYGIRFLVVLVLVRVATFIGSIVG